MELTWPKARRQRVTFSGLILALMLVGVGCAWTYYVVTESLAQRELAAGHGVPGDYQLDHRTYLDGGRGPGRWVWVARFRADDGSVMRDILDPPVGDNDDLEGGSGRFEEGDVFPAQWVPQTPGTVYPPDAGSSFWWVRILTQVVLPAFLVVIGVSAVWGYDEKHPDQGEVMAARSPTPSEREQQLAQHRAARAELDHLRTELEKIQREKGT